MTKCGICGQRGNSFQRVNPDSEQIETIDNPLSFYPPAASHICVDCRHECADDLVGAVNEAAASEAADRRYQSGYAYASGYRD